MVMDTRQGSLICVGLGISLGAHLTPSARSAIEAADVVFASVSDGVFEPWIQGMNPAFVSLQPLYTEGKSRLSTYLEMVELILQAVRAGKRVCVALYGHPGVFAWPAHRAIALAIAEGYDAYMQPGISASDCLYADLAIDPGTHGCQYYEATQWLTAQPCPDVSAYLILWQVGVAGDLSLAKFSTDRRYRALLLEVLLVHYPDHHQIILYEAASLAVTRPRIERIALGVLLDQNISLRTTVVIPPARQRHVDPQMRAKLLALQHTDSSCA
jgi:hypothetical protein